MAFVDPTTGARVIKEGIMPVKITLDDTCEVGDLIGYDAITDDAWERADANGKIPAQLVAGEKCHTSGDEITAYKMALVDFGSGCTATPGDMVYLSDTVGRYAVTTTWVPQNVGEMVSAQIAFVNPSALMPFGYTTVGVSGGFVRMEVPSGKTAMSPLYALRIDLKTIATSVIPGDAYILYLFGQMQQAPTSTSAMVRIEDGCASSCGFDSYILFVTGTGDPPDFLFELGALSEPTNNAWSLLTNSSLTAAGRVKIKVGGATRYISINSD